MSTGFVNKPIDPMPAFADILRDQELFGTREEEGVGNSINTWFDRLMIQSGIGIAPTMLLFLCVFLGVTLGGIIFIIQENLLSASLVGALGATLPVVWAVFVRQRRQKQMM